jgi:hypothetical protein
VRGYEGLRQRVDRLYGLLGFTEDELAAESERITENAQLARASLRPLAKRELSEAKKAKKLDQALVKVVSELRTLADQVDSTTTQVTVTLGIEATLTRTIMEWKGGNWADSPSNSDLVSSLKTIAADLGPLLEGNSVVDDDNTPVVQNALGLTDWGGLSDLLNIFSFDVNTPPDPTSSSPDQVITDAVHWPTLMTSQELGYGVGGSFPAAAPADLTYTPGLPALLTLEATWSETVGFEPDMSFYDEYSIQTKASVVSEDILAAVVEFGSAVTENGLGAVIKFAGDGNNLPAAVVKWADSGNAGTFAANDEVGNWVAQQVADGKSYIKDTVGSVLPLSPTAEFPAPQLETTVDSNGFLYSGFVGTWVSTRSSELDPFDGKYVGDLVDTSFAIVNGGTEPSAGDSLFAMFIETRCKMGTVNAMPDGSEIVNEGTIGLHVNAMENAGANVIAWNSIPILGYDGAAWQPYVAKAGSPGVWTYTP